MLVTDEYVTNKQKNVTDIYNVTNNITVTDRFSIDISDQGPNFELQKGISKGKLYILILGIDFENSKQMSIRG